MKDLSIAYEIRKRNAKKKMMAEGGEVKTMTGQRADRSDMDHGQKRGPQGYPKYQEQAQNEKGIHTPVSGVTAYPGGKGTSAAGDLAKARYAGKAFLTEASKDKHREKLAEMKAMPKPKIEKLAMGGMAGSSTIKTRMLDKYGNPMEEMPPKKYDGMSEDKGPKEEEYMDDEMAPMLAEGGEVEEGPEEEDEQHSSIAAAIMARKERKMMAEGGEVDIEDNNDEHAPEYNDLNVAALKENMDSDFEDMDQPEDSNMHADDIESDEHDMISKIRSKMRMKMAK